MLNDATCFQHVYIKVGYTDLRKGIDALVGMVSDEFNLDPTQKGNLFLFCGRRTDRIKGLTYEGDGYLLLYKRLAGDGHFKWPRSENEVREITPQQYRWLMEGLALEQKKTIQPVAVRVL